MHARSAAGSLALALLLAGLVLAGLGTANANPEFKLRFGSYAPEGDVIDRAAHHFKEGVARLTNGRVEITVFRSNALGSNREMIEMTKVGSLDFTVSGSTHISRFAPILVVASLPSLWKDRDTMLRIFDGEVGTRLNTLVARQGLTVLGWWETGFRHVSNNKRPIMKPDDIKGLKLRTLPSAVHVAYFRALGAIPTPMDWAEVMPALQQGVIDGQENPPSVVYPYRVFEFQKYYSLTEPRERAQPPADERGVPRQAAQGRAGGHCDRRPRGDRVPAQGVRRIQHQHHGRARQGDDGQRGPRRHPGAFQRGRRRASTRRPTARSARTGAPSSTRS